MGIENRHRMAWCAVFAAVAALMAGCGGSRPAPEAPVERIGSGLTLRYWAPAWLGGGTGVFTQGLPLFEELEKATGIRIEMTHPRSGYARNQLEELLAADFVPDILEWSWAGSYPGGPGQALEDGLLAPLGDLIARDAPNLRRVLSRNPEIGRAISTPDGRYYAFPDLRTDPALRAQSGPLFRKAWLEKIGAKPPQTVEEWHKVLREFKNTSFGTFGSGQEYPFYIPSYVPFLENDLVLPYFMESNAFAGAYGVSHGFYRREGALLYGPVQEGYRQMVRLLSSWYKEGLIHPSITDPRMSGDLIEAAAKCGAWIGGTDAAEYLKTLGFVPGPLPRLEGADPKSFLGPTLPASYTGQRAAAVGARSDHKTEAVRWLDLAYGEWGSRLFNFGVEGKSYKPQRGRPVLAEAAQREIARGSDAGYQVVETFYGFARGLIGGPYDVSADLNRQVLDVQLPGFAETVLGWNRGGAADPLSVLDADAERRDAFRKIFLPLRQHVIVNLLAFVCGQRDLAEFGRFQSEVEQMGLSEAMAIVEKADAAWRSKPTLFR